MMNHHAIGAMVLALGLMACSSANFDFASKLRPADQGSALPEPTDGASVPDAAREPNGPNLVDAGSGLEPVRASPLCGIYVLDGQGGTHRDGQIRAQPFVDGYVLRLQWKDVEPTEGAYDFSAIDHNLARLESMGQSLTLNFLAHLAHEPSYVVNQARQTWTFVDSNPNHDTCQSGCKRPVPWDAYAMERFEKLLLALADHRAPHQGQPTRLAEHPLVTGLNLGIVGWGSIRDLGGKVSEFPGYSRAVLEGAVLRSLELQTNAFAQKKVFVGFWKVRDESRSPELYEALRQQILAKLGNKVGFWMENLAHAQDGDSEVFRPTLEFADPLYQSREATFIPMQALTSWARPFTGENAVAGGNPVAAMKWARETFGTTYFEMYAADVDAAAQGGKPWKEAWQAFHDELCQTPPSPAPAPAPEPSPGPGPAPQPQPGPVAPPTLAWNYFLPAGHGTNGKRYPLVVWLHGKGGDENSGPRQIAPRLEQLGVEAVFLFPGAPEGSSSEAGWIGDKGNVMNEIVGRLIPYAKQQFMTNGEVHIEGFSMGGYGTIAICANNPGLCQTVMTYGAAMNPWTGPYSAWEKVENLRGAQIRMTIGTADGTRSGNDEFHQALVEAGIAHDYVVLEGVPHAPGAYYDGLGTQAWQHLE